MIQYKKNESDGINMTDEELFDIDVKTIICEYYGKNTIPKFDYVSAETYDNLFSNYCKVKKAYVELRRKEEYEKQIKEQQRREAKKIVEKWKREDLDLMSMMPIGEDKIQQQIKKDLERFSTGGVTSSEQVYCHLNPETEPNAKYYRKPPIGVKPCFIHAEERIKDLADGISRYAHKGDYEIIKKWAREICLQCELAEMEKENK